MALATGPVWARVAVLAGAELVSSVGVMLMDINLNSLIAKVTPGDARGRQAGAYSAVNYGIPPVGALVGGWRGTALGVRPSIAVAGIGGTLAVLRLLPSPVRRGGTPGPRPAPPRSADTGRPVPRPTP